MKVLSIQQPWAWLIVSGYKDIENRKWITNYRGDFLIHTGKKFDQSGYQWVQSKINVQLPPQKDFALGGLIGMAELVDCVTQSDSPWFFGPYGFVITNPRAIEFVPMAGKLGFFEIDAILEE